ncbi:uncharacterized protein [Palaemon carinicauda]|uniref:uncharacterized protein n=1 Tax=Palaemon carinicauda TaxID=392227 RepID=UPI0035B673D5
MQKLISKGYAEAVSTNVSIPGTKVWYLPHQAVVSDKKPGKIRILFDFAVKFDGEALNDMCLQRPNLTNNLLYVLLRFREHAYAVIADIEAMYYQSLVSEVVKGTTEVLRKGGFRLTKFFINDVELLSLVAVQERASEVEFLKDFGSRALGIAWDVAGDEFFFRVNLAQEEIRISKFIKPIEFNEATLELHHFSDASQVAYGCSSYLRSTHQAGEIHVALVVSKSKMAPIESMTIPRLELQAAVLAAKMVDTLRTELDLDLDPSYFWTDYEIVLSYISNESRRFNVFVGNRVSLIQQLTKPEQWSFVQGVQNPADLLTRGISPESLKVNRWFEGPEFLHDHKVQWHSVQEFSDISIDVVDLEVRGGTCLLVCKENDVMDKLFSYY